MFWIKLNIFSCSRNIKCQQHPIFYYCFMQYVLYYTYAVLPSLWFAEPPWGSCPTGYWWLQKCIVSLWISKTKGYFMTNFNTRMSSKLGMLYWKKCVCNTLRKFNQPHFFIFKVDLWHLKIKRWTLKFYTFKGLEILALKK